MPESPPVISAALPSSLPAARYRGASYFGFGSRSFSRPGLGSFCSGNGGLGSSWICGRMPPEEASSAPAGDLADLRSGHVRHLARGDLVRVVIATVSVGGELRGDVDEADLLAARRDDRVEVAAKERAV